MDAIVYLRKEHAKLRRALTAVNQAEHEQAQMARFNLFCQGLMRHTKTEQAAWYPVLRKYPSLRSILDHIIEDDKHTENTIRNFKKTKFNSLWKLRFHKFIQEMKHYAEEEERELFPAVRKILSKSELDVIGDQLKQTKKAI